MSMLIFNAGSSTLKFGFYTADAIRESGGQEEWPGGLPLTSLPDLRPLNQKNKPEAIGHRLVHGGTLFQKSILIDGAVKEGIRSLFELAPLHNPRALEVIEACEKAYPGTPQVAVFDTAFFASLPLRQVVYPLPYEWFSEWGIRRFGFHGISHSYCAQRAASLMKRNPSDPLRLVICHLGRGCSATATRAGQAVATSMGFTPMEGLMMGSRPGSIDPGIPLYVERKYGLDAERLESILNKDAGLIGVSGVSDDFREVETTARKGNERAQLALDLFVDRIRGAVGYLAVTLGGLDALVFAGGIGENSARLRAIVCKGLECLGLQIEPGRNEVCRPDSEISAAGSKARIWVIETREDDMIAQETSRLNKAALSEEKS